MGKHEWIQRARDELGNLGQGIDLDDAWAKYRKQARACVKLDKRDALGNPVRMQLTFVEWLRIWLESGHWDNRGPTSTQHCMARHNDIGDYAVGNVSIKTSGENVSEAHLGKTTLEATKQKMRDAHNTPEAKRKKCLASPNRINIVFRGVEYPSIRAAERATGVDGRTIRKGIL